jgi:hypothetical protein
MRERMGLLAGALALAAAAVPGTAGAAAPFYKVTVTGTQTVSWSFTGSVLRGGCSGPAGDFAIVSDDVGSGSATFRIRNSGKAFAAPSKIARRLAMTFSANVKAAGTMSGSYTVGATRLVGGPCDVFQSQPAVPAPTTNCGAQRFGLRLDAAVHGAFLWVNGPEDIVAAASPARGADDCPYPARIFNDTLSRTGAQNTACDPVLDPLWKRTYELNGMGRGWASVKIPLAPKTVLQPKGRVVVLARRVQKQCRLTVDAAGGAAMVVDVSTQLTLTLRKQ